MIALIYIIIFIFLIIIQIVIFVCLWNMESWGLFSLRLLVLHAFHSSSLLAYSWLNLVFAFLVDKNEPLIFRFSFFPVLARYFYVRSRFFVFFIWWLSALYSDASLRALFGNVTWVIFCPYYWMSVVIVWITFWNTYFSSKVIIVEFFEVSLVWCQTRVTILLFCFITFTYKLE